MRRFFLVMLSLVLVGALAGVGTSFAAKSKDITYSPHRISFGKVSSTASDVWQDFYVFNNTTSSVTVVDYGLVPQGGSDDTEYFQFYAYNGSTTGSSIYPGAGGAGHYEVYVRPNGETGHLSVKAFVTVDVGGVDETIYVPVSAHSS